MGFRLDIAMSVPNRPPPAPRRRRLRRRVDRAALEVVGLADALEGGERAAGRVDPVDAVGGLVVVGHTHDLGPVGYGAPRVVEPLGLATGVGLDAAVLHDVEILVLAPGVAAGVREDLAERPPAAAAGA